jgi:hypothetical protein
LLAALDPNAKGQLPMQTKYQARWISKERLASLRKSGQIGQGVTLDCLKGFLVVEPTGSNLGDGEILDRTEADYELNPAWCLNPLTRLNEARKRLGLMPEMAVTETLEVG